MAARLKRNRLIKTWLYSPEQFRELRQSCFMSRAQCAAFLGLSKSTIRTWETTRCRANWACIRLLRLYRLGDLGALHDAWEGWTINHTGLHAPDGRRFDERSMRHWWNTTEQARFWRRQYEAGTQLALF